MSCNVTAKFRISRKVACETSRTAGEENKRRERERKGVLERERERESEKGRERRGREKERETTRGKETLWLRWCASALRRPSGNHPLLVRHHPMRPSLLYPASPSTTSSLILSPSLSLSLTPSSSPPPHVSFRLSPSHLWHDVSPFRRSILLSSSAPRLV